MAVNWDEFTPVNDDGQGQAGSAGENVNWDEFEVVSGPVAQEAQTEGDDVDWSQFQAVDGQPGYGIQDDVEPESFVDGAMRRASEDSGLPDMILSLNPMTAPMALAKKAVDYSTREKAEGEDNIATSMVKAVQNTPESLMQFAGGLMQMEPLSREERLKGMMDQAGVDESTTSGRVTKHLLGAIDRLSHPLDQMKPEGNDYALAKFDSWIKKKGADLYKESGEEIEKNQPKGLDPVEQFFYDAAVGVRDMGLAIGAGYATRNSNVTLGIMGGQVYGKTYGESIEKGLDPYRAHNRSAFHTLAEIVPEKLPVEAILKGGKGVKEFLTATLGEGAQEMITSILQQAYDNKELEGMTLKEALLNIDWKEVGYSGLIGVGVGTALTGGVNLADRALGRNNDDEPDLGDPNLPDPDQQARDALTPKQPKPAPVGYGVKIGDAAMDEGEFGGGRDQQQGQAQVHPGEGMVYTQPPEDFMGREIVETDPVTGSTVARREGAIPELTEELTTSPGAAPDPAEQARYENGVDYKGNTEPAVVDKDVDPATGAVKVRRRSAIPDLETDVDRAAHEAATSPLNDLQQPTEAQKEAGNYKKGRVKFQGLDVAIENPKGSTRSGTDAKGKSWSVTMNNHYGYIQRTEGKDGDQVDVFLGPNEKSDQVFVIDQTNKKGKFDEHKVMLGFDSQFEAVENYKANYSKGWKVGAVTPMSMDQFKRWMSKGNTKAPAAEQIDALKPEYADPRLKREDYRVWAQRKVEQDMVEGGDIYYKTDEHDRITGRSSSVNPPWVQGMLSDYGMSVGDVKKAVTKALAGEKLGPRQLAVVQTVLDQVEAERTDPENIALAQERREAAKERRAIRDDSKYQPKARRETEDDIPFEIGLKTEKRTRAILGTEEIPFSRKREGEKEGVPADFPANITQRVPGVTPWEFVIPRDNAPKGRLVKYAKGWHWVVDGKTSDTAHKTRRAAAYDAYLQHRSDDPVFSRARDDKPKVSPATEHMNQKARYRFAQVASPELKAKVKQHEGSNWAREVKKSVIIRDEIERLADGKIKLDKAGSLQSSTKLGALLKSKGWEGAWQYVEQEVDVIGSASKPTMAVNSSFVNCNPSKACAKFCYATEGRHVYPAAKVKAELVDLLANRDPARLAKAIGKNFKTPEKAGRAWRETALRMFDVGDGSPAWVSVINHLNKQGIRVHVFSKSPEFLMQLDKRNIRLLSIDNTNADIAEGNDLPLSIVYTGIEDLPIIKKYKDRIDAGEGGVILPEGDSVTAEDIEAVPDELTKFLCPFDTGKKSTWNCLSCDRGRGIGCYSDSVTHSEHFGGSRAIERVLDKQIRRIQKEDLTNDEIDALEAEIRKQLDAVERIRAEQAEKKGTGRDIHGQGPASEAESEVGETEGLYAGYERETGNVQERKRRKAAAQAEQLAFNLEPPATVSAAKQQAADNFNVHYRRVPTGKTLRVGLDRVTNSEEAAHVLSGVRKRAEEVFYALVLDKDGKILDVQFHGKGTRDGAGVYPDVVVPSVAGVEGAAQVWFAHNHPSGLPYPSDADYGITKALSSALDGSGVEFAGHVVLGRGARAHGFLSIEDTGPVLIKPRIRRRTLEITERMIRKIPPDDRMEITSPVAAREYVHKEVSAKNALVMLNTQHQVIGSMALTAAEMKELRKHGRARRVLKALDQTNAAAVIIKSTDASAARNMARFLNQGRKTRILDAFVREKGSSAYISDAERGNLIIMDGNPFFSRRNAKTEKAEQLAFNLEPPATVSAAKQQAADNFYIHYRRVPTGEIRVGVDQVKTPEDAAHVFAPIRKHGEEVFYALVLDKDGNILDIQHHSKGTRNGASVYPEVVGPAIAAVQDAAQVWFAHNHPSGDPDPSGADFMITKKLVEAMDGAGVEFAGHIVTGRGAGAYYFKEGGQDSRAIQIAPRVRRRTHAVTERKIRRQPPADRQEVSSPDEAHKYVTETMTSADGLLLLDTRHRPVGVVALTDEEMATLREGGRAKRVFAAIDKTNASAAIIKSTNRYAARNLARFLNTANKVRVLDVFFKDEANGAYLSDSAMGGRASDAEGPFYSRKFGESKKGITGERSTETDRLQRAIEGYLGERFETGTYTQGQLPKGAASFISAFEEATGKRVVVFNDGRSAKSKERLDFNGVVLPSDLNVVYINQASDNHIGAILGHEFLHAIRRENPDLYARAVKALIPELRNVRKYKAWLDEKVQQETGGEASRDLVVEELVADLLGDRFMEPEFWQTLNKKNPSVFGRLAQSFKDFLDFLLTRLRGKGLGSHEYVRDMQKVRETLADMLADHVGDKSPTVDYTVHYQQNAMPAASRNRETDQGGTEIEEIIIEDVGSYETTDNSERASDLESLELAETLFLSHVPAGIKYYSRDTQTADRLKSASAQARSELGSSPSDIRRIRESYGPFSEYFTGAKIKQDIDGKDELHVEIFGKEQMDADLLDAPAQTFVLTLEGKLTVFGPASSSKTYEGMKERGWAGEAWDADGNPVFGGIDQGLWTRLEGVNFRQLINMLGDVHGRAKNWHRTPHVGVYWKRATGGTGGPMGRTGAVFFSRNRSDQGEAKADTFYSQMERVLEANLPGKGVPGSYRQAIQAYAAKGQIKQEELEWSGVLEWLDDQKGKLTKQQVLDYLRANQIRVDEVVKGEQGEFDSSDLINLDEDLEWSDRQTVEPDSGYVSERIEELEEEMRDEYTDEDGWVDEAALNEAASQRAWEDAYETSDWEIEAIDNKNGGEFGVKIFGNDIFDTYNLVVDGAFIEHYDSLDDAQEAALDYLAKNHEDLYRQDDIDEMQEAADDLEVNYEEHTLPGGENYRELLLTLPAEAETHEEVDFDTAIKEVNMGNSVVVDDHGLLPLAISESILRNLAATREVFGYKVKRRPTRRNYTNSHWSEKNVLAHVRFNERTDADGKHVLFIEEVQSDWHQQGRQLGYDEDHRKLFRAVKASSEQAGDDTSEATGWNVYDKNGNFIDNVDAASKDEATHIIARELAKNAEAVPDAPFKTSWPLLAMKRMIRYAAENGFDRIAWTTGEQQADRYDLSKKIDGLMYAKEKDGTYAIKVIKKLGERPEQIQSGVPENKLADYIGKDLAEKAVNGEGKPVPYSPYKAFYDVDLKIGGEGMKAFYDKMLPSMVNKYVKKWGAKVGVADLATAGLAGDTMGFHEFKNWMNENGYTENPLAQWKEEGPRFKEFESIEVTEPVHIVDVTDAMREAALAGQPLFSRKRSTANKEDSSWTVPDEALRDRLTRVVQDKFQQLYRLQNTIRDAGGNIDMNSDPYAAEERMHGKIENDLTHMEEDLIEPMVELMADANIDLEQLDYYLIARHARERNEYIASVREDMPDGGSGLTNKEADAIIARVEQSGKAAKFKELADMVYRILEHRRQVLSESGLLDDETIDQWRDSYQYYVPLKGFAEDAVNDQHPRVGRGISIKGKEFKRATGRKSLAYSPVIQAIQDTTESIIRHRKNEVGKHFLMLVAKNPNPDYWEVFTEDKPDVEPRNVGGKVVNMPVAMHIRPEYFGVKHEGKQYYVRMKDPLLVRAMNNLGVEQVNALLRVMGSVNRFLASVNTSYNPEFVVSNFARDIQTAIYNVLAEQDLHNAKIGGENIAGRMIKDVPTAIRAIYRGLRKKDSTSEYGRYFQDYLEDGAKTGYFDSRTLEQQKAHVEALIKLNKHGARSMASRTAREALKFIEDVNSAVENGVRLSAYVNARKALEASGYSVSVARKKAAHLAKNLTVNFNRRGEWGSAFNATYMFFNASVQGTAQFARTILTMKRMPDGSRRLNVAQKTAMAMTGFAFLLAELNRLVSDDDEDGETVYDNIPRYIKERNIVIMKSLFGGSGKEYWMLPLPYGYNIFHVLGTTTNDVVRGPRKVQEGALDITMAMLGSFNPIGISEAEDPGRALLKTAAPTVFTPGVELMANENHYGGMIYRTDRYNSRTPDSSLSMYSTKEHYKVFAQWLNEVTGGNIAEKGVVDVSPDTLEHWAEFITGGTGRFIDRTLGTSKKAVQGVDLRDREIPFWRKVSGERNEYNLSEKYYDIRDIALAKKDATMALPPGERLAFRRDNADWLRIAAKVESKDKRLKALRKRRDRIRDDDSLTPAERDRALRSVQEDMEAVYADFLKSYYRTIEGKTN